MDNGSYVTSDQQRNAEIALKESRARAEINRRHDNAACCGARELTVSEHLDAQIEAAERKAHALRDLKASLPGSFLSSGVSRIAPLSGV